MKKLLFVLCLVLLSTTLFYSCGSDDDNNGTEQQIETQIVQKGIKGKFFDANSTAYQFNDKDVDVWSDFINNGEYYQYQNVKYSIHPEKGYIAIYTSPETLLYYQIKDGKTILSTDKGNYNWLDEKEKPDNFENDSKQPTEQPTILTIENTIIDFDRWEDVNSGIRTMTVTDAKTKEIILTFNWENYSRIEYIGRADVQERKNLLIYNYGGISIRGIVDAKGKQYAFNTTTSNVIKVLRTEQNPNNMQKTSTLSINLEGKYIGEIGIPFYN